MEKTRMISHDKEKSNKKAIFICLRIRVIKFQALWRRIGLSIQKKRCIDSGGRIEVCTGQGLT